jgi:glycosyltransferase involved in cell wall biosynthesis
MKIDYIIPTLYRDTLNRAVSSIKQEGTEHNILICGDVLDGRGCGNRNKGLEKVNDSEWIIFLDDDDYLKKGFSKQLDNNFDIVVLRMSQNASNQFSLPKVIPSHEDSRLYSGNVGCNFAIKTSFYLKHKWMFSVSAKNPDWDFLERAIHNTDKIKLTDDIYYVAPMGGYNKLKPNGKR